MANTLASVSGGGAGLLQFPLLIFMGLPFAVALATHKLASVALGLGAAFTHLRSGSINGKVIVYLVLTGSIGVITGANLVMLIPEKIAQTLLGLMILALGIYSRVKKQLGQSEQANHRDIHGWGIGGTVMVLIGVINGSLTAGSGLLVTLFLVRWFWLQLQTSRRIDNDLRRFILERYRRFGRGGSRYSRSLALVASAAIKFLPRGRFGRLDKSET